MADGLKLRALIKKFLILKFNLMTDVFEHF